MESKTVLLIEDNAEDEFLIGRAVKRTKLPIRMITAKDGQEALDFVSRSGVFADDRVDEIPDLVLLDLDLPRIDGFEVLRAIREDPRMRIVPVVVFTASADERDRVSSYQFGANSYVVKPADGSKYAPLIQELCRYWLCINSALHTADSELGQELVSGK